MLLYGDIECDDRVLRSAEALSNKYNVHLLCLDSGRDYQHPKLSIKKVKLPTWRRFRGLLLVRFWFRACLEALRKRPQLVYAHDYFMAFGGWLAARMSRARLLYDAHELIVPGGFPIDTRRLRFFYALERWVVKRSDRIIAANIERAEIMTQHYKLVERPVAVRNIPTYPRDILSSQELETLYPSFFTNRDQTKWLVYQGDMDAGRAVDKFIRALKILDPKFRMVLVGSGSDLDYFKQLTAQEGLDERVLFLGKVPRSHLYGLLALCHIAVVSYPMKGLNFIHCASNKVFEYLQTGLPMVATSQDSIKSVFREGNLGVLVDIEANDKELIEAIANAINSIDLGYEGYLENLESYRKKVSWELESRQLLQAVLGLCD